MGTTIPTPQGLKWSAEAKLLGVWYTVGLLFGSPASTPLVASTYSLVFTDHYNRHEAFSTCCV